MSKKKTPATVSPAPENSDAAVTAENPPPKIKPTIPQRLETLEKRVFGHAPHAEE